MPETLLQSAAQNAIRVIRHYSTDTMEANAAIEDLANGLKEEVSRASLFGEYARLADSFSTGATASGWFFYKGRRDAAIYLAQLVRGEISSVSMQSLPPEVLERAAAPKEDGAPKELRLPPYPNADPNLTCIACALPVTDIDLEFVARGRGRTSAIGIHRDCAERSMRLAGRPEAATEAVLTERGPKVDPAPVPLESLLGNLLARILGDGGHYVEEHGYREAAEAAEAKVLAWQSGATGEGPALLIEVRAALAGGASNLHVAIRKAFADHWMPMLEAKAQEADQERAEYEPSGITTGAYRLRGEARGLRMAALLICGGRPAGASRITTEWLNETAERGAQLETDLDVVPTASRPTGAPQRHPSDVPGIPNACVRAKECDSASTCVCTNVEALAYAEERIRGERARLRPLLRCVEWAGRFYDPEHEDQADPDPRPHGIPACPACCGIQPAYAKDHLNEPLFADAIGHRPQCPIDAELAGKSGVSGGAGRGASPFMEAIRDVLPHDPEADARFARYKTELAGAPTPEKRDGRPVRAKDANWRRIREDREVFDAYVEELQASAAEVERRNIREMIKARWESYVAERDRHADSSAFGWQYAQASAIACDGIIEDIKRRTPEYMRRPEDVPSCGPAAEQRAATEPVGTGATPLYREPEKPLTLDEVDRLWPGAQQSPTGARLWESREPSDRQIIRSPDGTWSRVFDRGAVEHAVVRTESDLLALRAWLEGGGPVPTSTTRRVPRRRRVRSPSPSRRTSR